jgi:hypothetical protein
MSSIQRKMWESRIRDLPENKSGIGQSSSGPDTFTQGIGGGAADRDNPVSPGMGTDGDKKPGGKTPGGPTISDRWNAAAGKFEKDVEQFSWADKAVVDSINSSREAFTNLQKLGGLTKNPDVAAVVAKKMGSDISTLISSVGSEKVMNILRNEFGGNPKKQPVWKPARGIKSPTGKPLPFDPVRPITLDDPKKQPIPRTAGSEVTPDYTIHPDDIPDYVQPYRTPVYVTKPLPVKPKPFSPDNLEFPEGPPFMDPDLFGPDVLDPDERPYNPDGDAPILVTPYGPGGVIITIPGVGVFGVSPDGSGGKWYQMGSMANAGGYGPPLYDRINPDTTGNPIAGSMANAGGYGPPLYDRINPDTTNR